MKENEEIATSIEWKYEEVAGNEYIMAQKNWPLIKRE